ncbi:hypothetical protein H4R33_002926 [Dimargaris cristalligena]|nr:hypothetical protein H4R33_002926 [Dimargaris cristalligena]
MQETKAGHLPATRAGNMRVPTHRNHPQAQRRNSEDKGPSTKIDPAHPRHAHTDSGLTEEELQRRQHEEQLERQRKQEAEASAREEHRAWMQHADQAETAKHTPNRQPFQTNRRVNQPRGPVMQ